MEPNLKLRKIDRFILYSLLAAVLWFSGILMLAFFPWQ